MISVSDNLRSNFIIIDNVYKLGDRMYRNYIYSTP